MADTLEKNITRGFQLLSAYHTGRVGKSGYQEIHATIPEKDWKSDSFFEMANDMHALLFECDYFAVLKQWSLKANKNGDESYRNSLSSMLSEFSTIGFYVGLIKHFENLGEPTGPMTVKGKIFAKNAYSLFDELLFQVLNGNWGGAGDGKAESLIKKVADTGANHYKTTVSRDDWKKIWMGMLGGEVTEQRDKTGFIELEDAKGKKTGEYQFTGDIFDEKSELREGIHPNTEKKVAPWKVGKDGNFANQTFSKTTRIMMLHYYATTQCKAPREDNSKYKNWQWDHIIPQADFKTKNESHHKFCNNIANCQALPSHTNQQKSDEKLGTALSLGDSKINNSATQGWIKKYSGIEKADYADFSSAEQAENLVRVRGARMMEEFLDARDKFLA